MRRSVSNGFRVVTGDGFRLMANSGGGVRMRGFATCEPAQLRYTGAADVRGGYAERGVLVGDSEGYSREYTMVDEGWRIRLVRPIPRSEQGEFYDPGAYSIVGSVSFLNTDREGRAPERESALSWVRNILEVGGHVRHVAGGYHDGEEVVSWVAEWSYAARTAGSVAEGLGGIPLMADSKRDLERLMLDQAADPQVCQQGDWFVWRVHAATLLDERTLVPDEEPGEVASIVSVDQGVFTVEWTPIDDAGPTGRRARFRWEQRAR